jgi:hypothetical protein
LRTAVTTWITGGQSSCQTVGFEPFDHMSDVSSYLLDFGEYAVVADRGGD